MIDPIEIAAARGDGDHITGTSLIQRKGIDHALGDNLWLREGAHIHTEQDWSAAGILPFFTLFTLRLSWSSEFDIDKFTILVEWKNDAPVSCCRDRESVQSIGADLSGGKVADNGIGERQLLHIRQNELLFCSGGGTDQIRPLTKTFSQIFKAPSHAAGPALANIDTFGQIECKRVLVAVLAAVTDRAVLRNQLVAMHGIGLKMSVGKIDNGLR